MQSALGQEASTEALVSPSSAWQRRRPLFWLVLSFACGIWLDATFLPEPLSLATAVSLTLFGIFAYVLNRKATFPFEAIMRSSQLRFTLACIAGLLGGMCMHACKQRYLPGDHLARRTAEMRALYCLEGTVVSARRFGAARSFALLDVDVSRLGFSPDSLTPSQGRVRLSLKSPKRSFADGVDDSSLDPELRAPRLVEGDRIAAMVYLEAPPKAFLPEGFDPASTLARNGIFRIGAPADDRIEKLGEVGYWRLDLKLRRITGDLAERLQYRLGQQRGGLFGALLFGRKEGLDASDRESFSRTGTAHLLAISGLHLNILAGGLFWLLTRLGRSRRNASLLVAVASFLYALLCGFQAPIVRALIMQIVLMGGFLLRRQHDPFSAVALAGFLLLSFAPAALFTAGFQLSFLAVLALMTIYPALELAWVRRSEPDNPDYWSSGERFGFALSVYFRKLGFASFSAWLGTAPVVAWHMCRFAPFALPINLFVLPLTAFAMLGGLLALLIDRLAWWLEPQDVWTIWIFDAGFELACIPLTTILGFHRLLDGPFLYLDLPTPPIALTMLFIFLMGWVWVGRGNWATLPRMSMLFSLALLLLAGTSIFRQAPQGTAATILDLPSGQAALVQGASAEPVLIDCGGPGQGRQIAESLRKMGVRALAMLVITQDDYGAIGGAVEVVERIPIRRVVLPATRTPSTRYRALETILKKQGISRINLEDDLFERHSDGLDWAFYTDLGPDGPPRKGGAVLNIRVSLTGDTSGRNALFFVCARSDASLQRSLSRWRKDATLAEALRVIPGPGGRWPRSLEAAIAKTGASTILAGQGGYFIEDGTGFDLLAYTQQKGLRLISPLQSGSVKLTADRGLWAAGELEIFRDKVWHPYRSK